MPIDDQLLGPLWPELAVQTGDGGGVGDSQAGRGGDAGKIVDAVMPGRAHLGEALDEDRVPAARRSSVATTALSMKSKAMLKRRRRALRSRSTFSASALGQIHRIALPDEERWEVAVEAVGLEQRRERPRRHNCRR